MNRIPPHIVPTNREDAIDWLRLTRSRRVGPATFIRLLRQFGSVKAALNALPDIASSAGERGYAVNAMDHALAELTAAKTNGAKMICLGAQNYPEHLWDLPDPPPVLWTIGDQSLLKRPAIALVGARNASAIGRRMAAKLARELGALGYVVISGLARGIDMAAHDAALETGTIAIQAGGVDVIYPKESAELTEKIGNTGLRISEMPMQLAPQARHFPRRNRIISGLACAVVVIDGAAKSGSLITARCALDQGREVMAVPGHPMDARASGCNMLIRDGAVLVRSGADIHEALQRIDPSISLVSEPELPFSEQSATPQPSDIDTQVLTLLGTAPVSEDIVLREIDAPAARVMAALAELDLTGLIERQPGGLVARASSTANSNASGRAA